jgi:hypothetical protein
MAKYHVNPKTGRAGICRAKIKCPLGESTPHFPDKASAQEYVEESLKREHYGFSTSTKSSNEVVQTLLDLDQGSFSHTAETFLRRGLEGKEVTFGQTIEAPDYLNYTLLENNGNTFIVSTNGGSYSDFVVLNVDRVNQESQPQMETTSERVKDTQDFPKINQMFQEIEELDSQLPIDPAHPWRTSSLFSEGSTSIAGGLNRELVRDDGSKIISFAVKSPGDRKLTDLPEPVAIDLEFRENGERQNARMMDRGFVIYDTRAQQGVLLKHEAGSEGGDQDDRYDWDGQKLSPSSPSKEYRPSPADLYVITGTDTTVDTPYYKIL